MRFAGEPTRSCGGADFHCTPASGARFCPGAHPSFLAPLFLRDDDVFFPFLFCPEPPRCNEVCGVLYHFRVSAELLRCGYSEPGCFFSASQAVVDEQSTRTVWRTWRISCVLLLPLIRRLCAAPIAPRTPRNSADGRYLHSGFPGNVQGFQRH